MDSSELLSYGQYVWLTCTLMVSSCLSIVGSCLIIVMSRDKFWTKDQVYHRILALLSTWDILFSASILFQSVALPVETPNAYWASGNFSACAAVAFFSACFKLLGAFYNCALSLYFLLLVRYQWKVDQILWQLELPTHVVSAVVTLAIGIAGLATKSMAKAALLDMCFFGEYPQDCQKDIDNRSTASTGNTCVATPPFMPAILEKVHIGTVIVTSLIGFVATVVLYIKVRRQILKTRRYCFQTAQQVFSVRPSPSFGSAESTIPQPQGSPVDTAAEDRLRQVRIQSVLYSVIYLNTMLWPGLMVLVHLFYPDAAFAGRRSNPAFFILELVGRFFLPLQGALNLIVYLRPKYTRWRAKFPKRQAWWILWQLLQTKDLRQVVRQEREQSTVRPEQPPPEEYPPATVPPSSSQDHGNSSGASVDLW